MQKVYQPKQSGVALLTRDLLSILEVNPLAREVVDNLMESQPQDYGALLGEHGAHALPAEIEPVEHLGQVATAAAWYGMRTTAIDAAVAGESDGNAALAVSRIQRIARSGMLSIVYLYDRMAPATEDLSRPRIQPIVGLLSELQTPTLHVRGAAPLSIAQSMVWHNSIAPVHAMPSPRTSFTL